MGSAAMTGIRALVRGQLGLRRWKCGVNDCKLIMSIGMAYFIVFPYR